MTLRTHASGPCELVLERPLEHGVARLTRSLVLERGAVLDASLPRDWGRLELRVPSDAALARVTAATLGEGAGFTATVSASDGLAELALAPAGRLEVRVRTRWRWSEPRVLDLGPGEHAFLDFSDGAG